MKSPKRGETLLLMRVSIEEEPSNDESSLSR